MIASIFIAQLEYLNHVSVQNSNQILLSDDQLAKPRLAQIILPKHNLQCTMRILNNPEEFLGN